LWEVVIIVTNVRNGSAHLWALPPFVSTTVTLKRSCHMAAPKSKSPVSQSEFARDAKPLKLEINGQTLEIDTKEFSTGSFGWYYSGKLTIQVGDKRVPVQVGLNFTVVGSTPQ
jgi:hypothetical protein